MQFASFDLADPTFRAFGHCFSVQITTLENLYGLDPERIERRETANALRLRAGGLSWAGQQQRAAGEVELVLRREDTGAVRASVRARAPEPIRCSKLLLRDLDPALATIGPAGGVTSVGEHGQLLAYPTGLPAPFLCVRSGERSLGLRAEDRDVRAKRFALFRESSGAMAGRATIELIHEEAASRFSRDLDTPDWVVTSDVTAEDVARDHLRFAERALGLDPWERRADLPDWARDLRLVATLHGMHFTGRVFLRYDEMLGVLRFLAERIPGRHVLAYLPGWEGRYYWQYGDYRPEPRLGGASGFAKLCDGARELGVHVMPMFGANCANVWLPAWRDVDPTAYLKSATGNRFHGNQPDWDLSRAHDTGWQAWLNPGHPSWRDALASAIEALWQRFGFDAVFLDTVHAWTNDPDHAVHEGLRALTARLRSRLPGVLLAAEADYDALLPLFGLFQRPWWTEPAPWTQRYVRRFGHLCEGEPRGRTGVHEAGVHRSDAWQPAPGYLPTLAFQDGTLEAARDAIEGLLARLAARDDAPRGARR
ncbi:MAG: hypothetical protein JSU66_10665 [Deltaproteobacteria bacterium]|nr:MAG: hypothetical protein JSU66_10665 [Deltaproteobacteria bacterium]